MAIRRHPLHAAGLGLASPPPVPAPFPRPPAGLHTPPQWAVGFNDGSPLPLRSPHRWKLVADVVLGYGIEGADSVVHARVFEPDPTADAGTAAGAAPVGAEPVVLLAQFGDHRGRSATNSIEHAAAAAQARFYPEGQMMRVVLMYPHARFALDIPEAPLTLREVSFTTRIRRSAFQQWRRGRRARREEERGSWQAAVISVNQEGVSRHVLPNRPHDLDEWEFHDPAFGRELALEVPDDERDAIAGADLFSKETLRFIHPTRVRVPALLGATELEAWPEELYTAELVLGPEPGAYAAARYDAIRRRTAAETGFIDAFVNDDPDTFGQLGSVHTSE